MSYNKEILLKFFPVDLVKYTLSFLNLPDKLGLGAFFVDQVGQQLKEPRDDRGCAKRVTSYYGSYRSIPPDINLKYVVPEQTDVISFTYTTRQLHFVVHVGEIRSFDLLVGVVTCNIYVYVLNRDKYTISLSVYRDTPSWINVHSYNTHCYMSFDIYEPYGYQVDGYDFLTRNDILCNIRDITNYVDFCVVESDNYFE